LRNEPSHLDSMLS